MFAQRLMTRNTRQVLFAMIPFVFFGVQTAQKLMQNEPNAVQSFGAFITIWALINISISKSKYEESIEKWRSAQIWQYLKHQEAKNNFRDTALNLTFDVHALQIAQIATKIGVPNPFCEPTSSALEEFGGSVQKRLDEGEDFMEMQKNNDKVVSDFEEKYKVQVDEMSSWSSFLWKLEIGMAIWGTLQGAYGAQITTFLHQI